MHFNYAYYLIESGPLLEQVKAYIEDRILIQDQNHQLAESLGIVENGQYRAGLNAYGNISRVQFPDFNKAPIGFTKPSRKSELSHPKKNTEWDYKFNALVKYPTDSQRILTVFSVPTCIDYNSADGNEKGWCVITNPLNPCGFLFPSQDGPYCLYIPDVKEEIAKKEAEGYRVSGEAIKFSMDIDGCRRILQEEWELIVLQEKISSKKASMSI